MNHSMSFARTFSGASRLIAALFVLVTMGTGCASLFEESRNEIIFDFQFEQTMQEWSAGYADYPTSADSAAVDFSFQHRALPSSVNASRNALFLGGSNVSGDLFMFTKRQIAELTPGMTYEVRYTIQAASNAPDQCSGTGGAPGQDVVVKGGVSADEPQAVMEGDRYLMNVDKGSGLEGGSEATAIGTIENGSSDCQGAQYRMVTLHSQNDPMVVTANENGALWFFVGTDSAFEGRTELYYDSIEVRLSLR